MAWIKITDNETGIFYLNSDHIISFRGPTEHETAYKTYKEVNTIINMSDGTAIYAKDMPEYIRLQIRQNSL